MSDEKLVRSHPDSSKPKLANKYDRYLDSNTNYRFLAQEALNKATA
ncbi:MAG: hypothetical protein RMZ69_22760 [Nostoc sp. ChiQUE01a]|nr:hypothetical protein [Nostoc sp. ChiQUE01a]